MGTTGAIVKGYYISTGYMGWVGNRSSGSYRLFATEGEYLEYVREEDDVRESGRKGVSSVSLPIGKWD